MAKKWRYEDCEKLEMKEKIVLYHTDGLGGRRAFDLFVKEGTELDEEEREFVESLYHVNCEVAQKFLERFPKYTLLGSEDLLHFGEANAELSKALESLCKKGWQWIDAASLSLEEK